ncbi:methyltransferase domain-containing protein [Thermococcus sp. 101 C5]|uniref:RsmB/NOP family class I SAM-dependent RNA methyltransferase n=1 Tax=Thermococcus TaxID=2263 RepID=UPI00128C7A5D|nr:MULTISPECIES: RsmB/NOP family class I SAM-dependent RNA methyltransferase [Thermococcus]MCA6214546.1 RsmB/NOP family class I SAM-dependent RNA methyltransferase [Thermococcus bergensis]MPW38756.1 methyltransferase domain-containing protein [Thermococcus sp. 101 C5]
MELFYRITLHELIADVLTLIEERELSSKNALERVFNRVSGKDRERARGLAHAYVFEIEKWRKKIDFIANSVLKGTKIGDLELYLANLLRIGIFEMKFKGVAPAIATDSVVRVVKEKYDLNRAKFVNAVLREAEKFNLDRALKKLKEKDRIEYLSVKFSHPRWYVEYVIDLLGYENAVRLLLSNNKPQRYYVRVNPLKTDIDSLAEYLEEHNVRVAKTPVDDVLKILEYKTPITHLDWYKEGYFVIQDLASAYVAHVLSPEKGERILDLAAAPGSKTFHVAHLMENTGEIVAVDYSLERLKKMEAKMKLLGVRNVRLVHADGMKFKDKEEFDRIILDAPCSSSGTYRQFPEVKWRFDENKIKKVIQVQKAMLRNAYRNLRKDGEMTYSTCSIRVDENEENIKYAISRVGFELINYPFEWGERGFTEIGDKVFRSFTHLHDCNSFFIAKLKK